MARLSTCKDCGNKITKEDKYTYSNKTYCKNCYDKKMKEKEQYDSLIKIICDKFNIDVPTGLILKQIKDYKEKFNYVYSGMTYCIWYSTDILKLKLDLKYGIAFVKFQYENAKDYYESQQKINKSMKDFKVKEVIKKVKICKNKSSKFIINLDELKED